MPTIYFRNLPEGFQNQEEAHLVGVDLSGIQRFIFSVTDNEGSLRQIKENSLMIERLTERVLEELETVQPLEEDQIVTKTSGRIHFIVKEEKTVEKMRELLQRIQEDVYLSFAGELRLYHTAIAVTLEEAPPKRENLAHRNLLQSLGEARRKDYGLLDCAKSVPKTDYRNTLDVKLTPDSQHAKNIDELLEDGQKHRYTTGMKLDFDNLGSYFQSLGYADEIKKHGQEIEKKINDVLAEIPNIYKVFVGGDDIFILCNFYRSFDIAADIAQKLRDAFADFEGYDFGVSCGMVHFREKTSIVYYGEKLEDALLQAKTEGKDRIVIEDVGFTWEEFRQLNREMKQLHKKKVSSSQLANIEKTLYDILAAHQSEEKEALDIARDFILKIPLIQDRVQGLIPKRLLRFRPEEAAHYVKEAVTFYFAVKYGRRLKERSTMP